MTVYGVFNALTETARSVKL